MTKIYAVLALVFCSACRIACSQTCTPAWATDLFKPPGTNGEVLCSTLFDDGSGLKLYVGGRFTTAGGTASPHIARWDGNLWSPVGQGISDQVRALAVFNDG